MDHLIQQGHAQPYGSCEATSMTGHEMWMGGASEVVYSLLMMQHGFIAPNINLTDVDEAAKPLRLATKMEAAVRHFSIQFLWLWRNEFDLGD